MSIIVVDKLLDCDICEESLAMYTTRLGGKSIAPGILANVCDSCLRDYGTGIIDTYVVKEKDERD